LIKNKVYTFAYLLNTLSASGLSSICAPMVFKAFKIKCGLNLAA